MIKDSSPFNKGIGRSYKLILKQLPLHLLKIAKITFPKTSYYVKKETILSPRIMKPTVKGLILDSIFNVKYYPPQFLNFIVDLKFPIHEYHYKIHQNDFTFYLMQYSHTRHYGSGLVYYTLLKNILQL